MNIAIGFSGKPKFNKNHVDNLKNRTILYRIFKAAALAWTKLLATRCSMRPSLWRFFLSILLISTLIADASASWVSDITGINIDIPAGKVTFGPPRPDRIPLMLQNLPKDAATFFLNPFGNPLAFAIRQAKAQERQNCVPVPPQVVGTLSRFFPGDVFSGVCWNLPNGGNLATLAIQDGNMGAVTLEDVVVFADVQLAQDPVIWSHELTHVMQYRRLGVEGFAAIYAGGWDALEQEARNFDQFVARTLQQQQQQQQYWSTAPGWNPTQQITSNQYTMAAKQYINPQWCSHFELTPPGNVTVINSCPIPIRVTGFYLRNGYTGAFWQMPCNSQMCFIAPGAYSTWPDNPPWFTSNVFFVW